MTDLELIYDWAKCGIYHNHAYNEPKLNHNLEILESVKKSIDELYQVKSVSEEKDRRIRELTEVLQSVWRLKDLIGYSDLPLAAHLGEAEAIEKMLQQVKQALNPPKP